MGKLKAGSFINHPQSILILLVVGFLLRMPFVPLTGFEQDFLTYSAWATHGVEQSLITIYDDPSALKVDVINYPPLYLYILWLLGWLHRLMFSGALETQAFMMMIKISTVIFETLFSLLLYRWIAKRRGEEAGRLAFGLFFLNPAIIYVSAYYGQVDILYAGFLFCALAAWLDRRGMAAGALLALALLTKLQTLPFVPFLLAAALLQSRGRRLAWAGVGFIAAALPITAPYWLTGRLEPMIDNVLFESFEWWNYLSVGAFNLWYFHADPYILDHRLWGWLYGSDGMLEAFAGVTLFTYKNLGAGMFGLVFLASLYWYWRQPGEERLWLAASHIALAFYMLPTKVHERFLYPLFLLYLPLAMFHPIRRGLFYGFSLTYLINLMVVCPLLGPSPPVDSIDSTLGIFAAILNLIFYVVFLAFEYGGTRSMNWDTPFIRNAVSVGAGLALVLFLARSYERLPTRNQLYLSQLMPVEVEQDWPPVVDKLTPGYRQLKRNFSTDGNPLRIDNSFFRYGLGAHANSVAVYEVSSRFDYFEAWIGVDAEVRQAYQTMPRVATVTFEVWINDEKRYQSPLVIPTMPARRIAIPLDKAQERCRIRLVVTDGGDTINETHSDHADWALARVVDVEKDKK